MSAGDSARRAFRTSPGPDALARSLATAVVLHVGAALALGSAVRHPRPAARTIPTTSVVDLETPPPPPPPPPPEPEPERQPEPEPPPPVPERAPPPRRPVAATPARAPARANPEPAPAPTQAAPVMTAPEPPEFDMDNNDTVAVGNNPNATGDVASNGVMRGPGQGVRNAAQGGSLNGTGRGPAIAAPPVPPPIDYSSHASLDCDEDAVRDEYPEAALEAGITERVVVRLRVATDARGQITAITPLNNPGYGFVAAAQRVVRRSCRVNGARDRAGQAVPDVRIVPVTFERD